MTDLFHFKIFRISTVIHTSVVMALLLAPAACAAADAEKGATIFKKKCSVCHAVGADATNRVGPILNGIVGRTAGTVAGFKYSKANAKAGEEGWVWTEESLLEYLANPRKAMPGNRMGFAGLPEEQDRVDVVAYLSALDSSGEDAGKPLQSETTTAKSDGDTEDSKVRGAEAETTAQSAPAYTEQEATAEAPNQNADASEAAVALDEFIIGGATPSRRPPGAPHIEEMKKDADWYRVALTGLEPPYPASFRFLEDQGRWYTPFNRPGMTGPYDMRGWHQR